ncbi:hypothetical protein VUR80DRAFT_5098 [Thermomyces stellatus]
MSNPGLARALLAAAARANPASALPRTPVTTHLPTRSRRLATACSPRKMTETIPRSSIRVLRTVDSLRSWREPHAREHRLVGLVPTMGALHEGHLSLVRRAARENHHVVVSIYLNPAQFGASEDFSSYPSTWDSDVAALAKLDRELADDGANLGRVSAVFAPPTSEMYPEGFPGQEPDSKGSFVSITPVGEVLEGRSRPTFFRGVATVCMKLFNAVRPDKVYFGQKDVQQTVVIRRLVRDFLLPIEVVVGETVRDSDGLAQSSRNVYLGPRRRAVAPIIAKALRAAEEAYNSGENSRDGLLGKANIMLETELAEQRALPPTEGSLFEVDYVSLADPETMLEIDAVDPAKGAILSSAIKMLPVAQKRKDEDLGHHGGPPVRLIDNVMLPPRKG